MKYEDVDIAFHKVGVMGGSYPCLEVMRGGGERQKRATALLLAHHVERLMPPDKDYGFSMGYCGFHLECENEDRDAALNLLHQAVAAALVDEAKTPAPLAFTFCEGCLAWMSMPHPNPLGGGNIHFCTRRPPHPTQVGEPDRHGGPVVGNACNIAIPAYPATMAKHGCWDGVPKGK